MALPPNIHVNKPRKAKGWSYPVQTTELIRGLGLDKIKQHIVIEYDNHPQHGYKFSRTSGDSFFLIRCAWFGTTDEPFFRLTINALPASRRQYFNRVVKLLFPPMRSWLEALPKNVALQKQFTTLFGMYRHYEFRGRQEHPQVILHRDFGQELFKMDVAEEELPAAT
ncbi:MAG: hypothetical protein ACREGR_01745 [Minisyncoccia bacterium]